MKGKKRSKYIRNHVVEMYASRNMSRSKAKNIGLEVSVDGRKILITITVCRITALL